MESLLVKNVSYLKARDDSIQGYNGPYAPAEVRTNLNNELKKIEDEDNRIKVYLRIKAATDFKDIYEIKENELTCKVPKNSHSMRNMKDGDSLKKTFKFSNIFNTQATQREIFNNIVKPKMFSFINGTNCTLLTYGASGSGKTFTVIGTAEEPGIVPRSLEYLFRTIGNVSQKPIVKPLPNGEFIRLSNDRMSEEQHMRKQILNASTSLTDKAQHTRTYMDMQQRLSRELVATVDNNDDLIVCIWVSFAEIYNEYIYDLLQPDPQRGQQRPKLRLVCMQNQQNYIKDLTTINVTSGIEAYQILQYGIHNLNYAATNVNSHSSRSHSIFTVKVVQLSKKDGGVYSSSFNFCDLAGSERSKKTQNVGDRLKESNNINSSLLVLGRCMNAVRNLQKQNDHKLIPFRESKLTHLFQKALSGSEDIAMIVNISPAREMFDETQHVLNFSAIASDITIIRPPEAKPMTTKKENRFSQYLQKRVDAAGDKLDEKSFTEPTFEDLRSAVYFLQRELEVQRIDFEEQEKMSRNYIISGYKELLKDNDINWEKKVKKTESELKQRYENVIKKLQDELNHEKARPNKVISLDSSDEEDDERTVGLKKDLQEAEQNILEKQQTVIRLNNQIRILESAKEESDLTLIDARMEYQDMQRKKDEEIFKLEEKCAELQTENETLRFELIRLRNECESGDGNDGEDDDNETDTQRTTM